MSRIDWDAYFDGTMSPAQRAEIDASPELCRARDGFKAFRNALQESAHQEVVPIGLLEGRLSKVVGQPAKVAPKWVIRTAPVLACMAALAWWVNQPHATPSFVEPTDAYALARTPSEEVLQTSDVEDAALWIASRKPYAIPVVSMKDAATLTLAKVGRGWASYDFKSADFKVVLEFSPMDHFEGAKLVTISNRPFFRGKKGLGWREQGMSFYVNGCSAAKLEASACLLYDAVKAARRVKGKKKGNSALRPIVKAL